MHRVPPLAVRSTPKRHLATSVRRPRYALAPATRELESTRVVPMWRATDAAGSDEPPPVRRSHRPRTWRQVRVEERSSVPAPASRAVREADTRIGLAGMVLGLAASLLVIRSTAPWRLHGDWLIATIPLVTLWTSVGGLVALAIAHAARGADPVHEISFAMRRSILKPVAIGVAAGITVVGLLHAAITVFGWLSMRLG